MVSLSKIASLPEKFLQTTGTLKSHFAFSIDLTNQWFDYFGHNPSKGFTNVATEAKTVMGFISGIEFFRDVGSSINQIGKQPSFLDLYATAASLSKKMLKFCNYLHTKNIFQFSIINGMNIQESFFGTVASTISCYKALSRGKKSALNNSAAIIESGAFAMYDGLSFLDKMGWTREFKTAKMYVATVGVAASIFQVGYKHFS